MSKKLLIIVFLIGVAVIGVLWSFGFGIHTVYEKSDSTEGIYTDDENTSSVFFDYDDGKLKSIKKTFLGILYNTPCFAFGCISKQYVFQLLPLGSREVSFKNKCVLHYENLAETNKLIKDRGVKYEIPDRTGKGFVYTVECEPYWTEADENGEYYNNGFIERFDPVADIASTYPQSLGILLKRNVSFPTEQNRIVPL